MYIVEINHSKGFAVINTPIYAGEKYPLLPDYHDIFIFNKNMNKALKIATLTERRRYILKLINEKRLEYGVPGLGLNEKLNLLAQDHADDMAANNYVSHTNLKG